MVDLSIVMLVDQRLNLHFPMGFPMFSHFPMGFVDCSNVFICRWSQEIAHPTMGQGPWGTRKFHAGHGIAVSYVLRCSYQQMLVNYIMDINNGWEYGIILWINTYENTIFNGMNIYRTTSYFDVNRRGTIGFDTLPDVLINGLVFTGTFSPESPMI